MDDIDVTEPVIPGDQTGQNFPQGKNQNDPLFLSNSDHPGMQLVSTHFNGSNFPSWNRQVKMALGAKMKLGFINGMCPRPLETHDDYQRWIKADFMVMSWIINSMVADIAEGFIYTESSEELWKEVFERFSESNAPLIYQLQKELCNLRQENLSIAAYYGKLKKIWDELQMLEGVPTCVCGALKNCS